MNRRTLTRSRTRAAVVTGLAGVAAAAVLATGLAQPGGASTADAAFTVFRPQLVRVATPSLADREALVQLGLDVTEHAGTGFTEVVLHSVLDRSLLRAQGYSWQVEVADLVARQAEINRLDDEYAARVSTSGLPSGNTGYRTLADYNADMLALAEKYPRLVKSITLPHPSLDGKTVYGIEIGSDVTKPASGRPTFFIMGAHHAREWPSGENTMEFAVDLATSYGKDKRITALLRKARVLVVPIVNVDGFDLSRTSGELADLNPINAVDPTGDLLSVALTPGLAYMRKNCRIVDGVDTPDGSCLATLTTPAGFGTGVDLNRNYGGFWGGPGAAATEPNPANVEAGILDPTYRGAAPFSEPETQNIRELIEARQVTMLITNHTSGNLILRPNGVNPETVGPDGQPVGDAPDEAGLKSLGARMAAQNGYSNQHGWELYDTTGTTEDWSYNATGGYGYTFEIGANEFHPPFEQVVDQYLGEGKYAGKGNRAAYLIALEHAADLRYSGLLKGRAPKGAVLRLTKSFDTPTWESTIPDTIDSTLTVGKGGSFRWVVNPSTRPVVLATDPKARETYTLTCEVGGKVRQRLQVFIDRGQVRTLDLRACGRD